MKQEAAAKKRCQRFVKRKMQMCLPAMVITLTNGRVCSRHTT